MGENEPLAPSERRLADVLRADAGAPEPLRERLRRAFTQAEPAGTPAASRGTGEGRTDPRPQGARVAPPAVPSSHSADLRIVSTSEPHPPARLRPDEAALARALAPEVARAKARARCRTAFLTRGRRDSWAPVRRAGAFAGLAAAAAFAVWIGVRGPALEAPRWQLLEGSVIAVKDASWRGSVLEQTGTATVGCSKSRGGMCLGDGVHVELVRGTRAKLCPPARSRSALDAPVELIEGELLVHVDPTTGPVRLRVRTEEASIDVVGTSLSVKRVEEGTCICVAEGTVEVSARGGGTETRETVRANESLFVFRDGRSPVKCTPGARKDVTPELEEHRAALRQATERWHGRRHSAAR